MANYAKTSCFGQVHSGPPAHFCADYFPLLQPYRLHLLQQVNILQFPMPRHFSQAFLQDHPMLAPESLLDKSPSQQRNSCSCLHIYHHCRPSTSLASTSLPSSVFQTLPSNARPTSIPLLQRPLLSPLATCNTSLYNRAPGP
ncbi:hypothetical protein CUMW_197030 [Citrus unshiu]|uniref:Uncharacterized protein n=1 Tax=Citrus unshiu TaxID=55188 RepID=A0A2H5Q547_CITUN|nr:hypothetical protein CUMW_197030 [Citrus unshiu]